MAKVNIIIELEDTLRDDAQKQLDRYNVSLVGKLKKIIQDYAIEYRKYYLEEELKKKLEEEIIKDDLFNESELSSVNN